MSGFYHPDFHIGNILYSPTSESFALVDVYGISLPKKLSDSEIAEHTQIVLELYRGLSDSEATNFLMQIRNDLTLGRAKEIWQAGLESKALKAQASWQKRQAQIHNNYSKFVEVLNISNNEFLVRKTLGIGSTVSLNEIPDCLTGNHFDIMRLSHDDAQNFWMESFYLEILGIDHLRPLIFEKPGVLYFEKAPDGAPKASPEKAAQFIARAEIAGVTINPNYLLELPNGRIVISKM